METVQADTFAKNHAVKNVEEIPTVPKAIYASTVVVLKATAAKSVIVPRAKFAKATNASIVLVIKTAQQARFASREDAKAVVAKIAIAYSNNVVS